MAAYAGVVSVMHLMEQIQVYHAAHSIFLDKQQRQLESLHKKVSFFQDFLENYSNRCSDDEAESFESRIADAAYAVEDVIESYILDHIHARSGKKRSGKNKQIILGKFQVHLKNSPKYFSRNVQTIVEYMDSIKREVKEIKGKSRVVKELQPREASSSRLVTMGVDTMVGFDAIIDEIVNKLTAHERDVQVMSVVGMGGSGKSTLAKKIYDDKRITERFDVCRWFTVSQEFNIREMLVLSGRDHQLGEELHKMLSGRRYFIVIDDLWSIEAWDKIRLFLPNDSNGSRIMITTRLSDLASDISSSNTYKMNFLNDSDSWSLLQRKVFSAESCPPELEGIGKEIAENCKGLPLSIVVIGGLLAKSLNKEYWKSVAVDVSKSANSEENDCLKTLDLSYRHLPIHLKPCFLYFGVFPEDYNIEVSRIVKLWIAEGFLKPKEGKILEEVAIVYLDDLINRNLIFVSKLGYRGQPSMCKIHDLLRDLCLREAAKQRFFYAIKVHYHDISQGVSSKRRIALVNRKLPNEPHHQVNDDLQSSPFLRSFACHFNGLQIGMDFLSSFDVELFRVLRVCDYSNGVFPKLLNIRYLEIYFRGSSIPSSMLGLLWNLQTINLYIIDMVPKLYGCVRVPSEFWEMSQLRHVMVYKFKVDDPCGKKRDGQDSVVLENLQTLSHVVDFRCSEEVLEKIPNVKKLKLTYRNRELKSEYIKNVGRMKKLESLECQFDGAVPKKTLSELEFSRSLKKLWLGDGEINWEDIGKNIGSLPHLEKLTLFEMKDDEEWISVEGQFPCLKHLEIWSSNLTSWIAESVHFPCLEKLELHIMHKLEEIPSEIGDVPTLQLIRVFDCSDSANVSAWRIREEQKRMGNETLRIII